MSLMVTLCTIHHIIKPVDRKHHMPLPIFYDIGNFMRAQTVDTRPFFLRWVGPALIQGMSLIPD